MPRSPTTFAKHLRSEATEAESLLWPHLRAHRFSGYKFKRQQPVGRYVVDFVCLSARLIVEVDGAQHLDCESDRQRDDWLRAQGFEIVRFWNNDVMLRTESVLQHLLERLPLSPGPSPTRGEGRTSQVNP